MDLCSLSGSSPSGLLPTHEVVGAQVPQAGLGCGQLTLKSTVVLVNEKKNNFL